MIFICRLAAITHLYRCVGEARGWHLRVESAETETIRWRLMLFASRDLWNWKQEHWKSKGTYRTIFQIYRSYFVHSKLCSIIQFYYHPIVQFFVCIPSPLIVNQFVFKANSDVETEDNGSECVICMCEVRDTLILPCRHLCLCNSCADSLRYQANNCPICRAPFRALLQIRALQKSNAVGPAIPADVSIQYCRVSPNQKIGLLL